MVTRKSRDLTFHKESCRAGCLAYSVDSDTGVLADIFTPNFVYQECVAIILLNELPAVALCYPLTILECQTLLLNANHTGNSKHPIFYLRDYVSLSFVLSSSSIKCMKTMTLITSKHNIGVKAFYLL